MTFSKIQERMSNIAMPILFSCILAARNDSVAQRKKETAMDMNNRECVKKEYASKATGNAGLTLGIIGTALGAGALWGRGGLPVLGGGTGMPENVNINMTRDALGRSSGTAPTAFQAWEKSCDDAIELTNTIWRLQMNEKDALASAREKDIQEKFSLYKGMTDGMFSLYKSQVDADFGLYKAGRDRFDVLNERLNARFGELDKKIAVIEAVRPYQDALIKQDIRSAYVGAVNYTDRKTCRCIYGELVLPSTPTVTGYQSQNPFGCNCQAQAQQTTPSA